MSICFCSACHAKEKTIKELFERETHAKFLARREKRLRYAAERSLLSGDEYEDYKALIKASSDTLAIDEITSQLDETTSKLEASEEENKELKRVLIVVEKALDEVSEERDELQRKLQKGKQLALPEALNV